MEPGAPDPLARRDLQGRRLDQPQDVAQVPDGRVRKVQPLEKIGEHHEMGVGIDEPRKENPAIEVDDLGLPAGHLPELRLVAQGDDLLSGHSDGPVLVIVFVQPMDDTVHKEPFHSEKSPPFQPSRSLRPLPKAKSIGAFPLTIARTTVRANGPEKHGSESDGISTFRGCSRAEPPG